ncbi:hypothetical protein P4280_20910 [Bacillus thuringiensis]|nr:hypothetical protein [Bacillus thuringiensis]
MCKQYNENNIDIESKKIIEELEILCKENEIDNIFTNKHLEIIRNSMYLLNKPATTLFRGDRERELIMREDFEGHMYKILIVTSVHQDFQYSRQIIALKMLESIENVIRNLRFRDLNSSAFNLRLILESLALYDQILRECEQTMADIERAEKRIVNFGERYSKMSENLYKISKSTLKVSFMSRVNRTEYSKKQTFTLYSPPEDYYNPTKTHTLEYSKNTVRI